MAKWIMPSKTTVNWLLWSYLFIACFDWKVCILQQTAVRVFIISLMNQQLNQNQQFRKHLAKIFLKKSWQWNIKLSIWNDINATSATSNTCQQFEPRNKHYIRTRINQSNTTSFPKEKWCHFNQGNDKTCSNAIVLGWGGKSTGKNKSWVNVWLNETDRCINLDKVHWRNAVEDINIVQIPKSDQNHEDCIKVKHEELDTLKYFNTYDKVANTRQFHISTTWVLWKKGDATRACLVA